MSDNTVTKSVLINAFKEFRKQVREDTKDIVHDELTEFYAGRIQPEIDKLRTDMDNRFEKVDNRFEKVDIHFGEVKSAFKKVNTRLDKLETNVSFIKDNIEGLKSDLSSKVSREELDPMKTRIRRLEIAKGDI